MALGRKKQSEGNGESQSRQQIIRVGKYQYMIGLYWHPLNQVRKYRTEAVAYGKQEKMEAFVIRKNATIIQAGFAANTGSAGKHGAIYSLASVLTETLASSFVACFALERGFGLIICVDGVIIAGCDRICATPEEVRERISRLATQGILNRPDIQYYAPLIFAFDEADELDLQKLLLHYRPSKSAQLTPLRIRVSSRQTWVLAAGIVVLAILVALYQFWIYHKANKEREAALAAERERLAQQMSTTPSIPELTPPWHRLPTVGSFVAACSQAQQGIPFGLAGWTLESVSCQASGLLAVYARTGNATALGFSHAAKAYFTAEPAFVIDSTDTVAISIPLDMPEDTRNEEPRDVDEALKGFTSYFLAIGIKPSIARKEALLPKLPGEEDKPAPVAPWKIFDFSFESTVSPAFLLSALPATGVRIHEITAVRKDAAQFTWKVSGELYAK